MDKINKKTIIPAINIIVFIATFIIIVSVFITIRNLDLDLTFISDPYILYFYDEKIIFFKPYIYLLMPHIGILGIILSIWDYRNRKAKACFLMIFSWLAIFVLAFFGGLEFFFSGGLVQFITSKEGFIGISALGAVIGILSIIYTVGVIRDKSIRSPKE